MRTLHREHLGHFLSSIEQYQNFGKPVSLADLKRSVVRVSNHRCVGFTIDTSLKQLYVIFLSSFSALSADFFSRWRQFIAFGFAK